MNVQFKCQKCGAIYEGTSEEIACNIRATDNDVDYRIEWDCIVCECGEDMLPVKTSSVLIAICECIGSTAKTQQYEEQRAVNEPQILYSFNWKPRIEQKNVRDTYFNVELNNGMRLEYWPAKDVYRYQPHRKRGVAGREIDKKPGGVKFILELAEKLNGAGR